jgi:hypothetical protein
MKLSKPLARRSAAFVLALFAAGDILAQNAVDTSGARQNGYNQGQNDGRRDGRNAGQNDGAREGQANGYRDGFGQCEAQERQKAYDSGFADGVRRGEWDGDSQGRSKGDSDGRSEGHSEGRADGDRRADSDAYSAATPPGRARGRQQADASDAPQQGRSDGLVAGDEAARRDAVATDYPRGRKAYRDERFAEPILNKDAFSQLSPSPFEAKAPVSAAEALQARAARTLLALSARTVSGNCNYPTNEEVRACQDGYEDGYRGAYDSEYRYAYQGAYDGAYRGGSDRGCWDARSRNYSGDYNQGSADGYRQGYDRAYQVAYRRAYDSAYGPAFRNASDAAYNDAYQGYYNYHFENARVAAYRERYNELYEAAFDTAKAEKYAQVYPIYAEEEYQRGRADETADFQARPVRLLQAALLETIPNGIFEPGEVVRVRAQLRNFADAAVLGRDVKLQVRAADAQNTVVAIGEVLLARDLRNKSLTTVSDLFEVRFNESAAGKATKLVVTASYQGRGVGEITLDLTPQFMIDVKLAENPVFQEGLETFVRVQVRNRSTVATSEGLTLKLATSMPDKLELVSSEANAGILQAGASGVFEFRVIAHTGGNSLQVPLTFGAILGNGRRVGLLQTNDSFPVRNDFRIKPTSALDGLRKKGVTRITYRITNVGSADQFKGLQLKISVLGANAAKFQVVGPNPQYLPPLDKGQSTDFVVPLLAKEANTGGKVQLEIQEDGKTVVIHQAAF